MARIIADRVRETSASTGTGNIVLAGAASGGYRTFGAVMNEGDTAPVTIENETAGEWEVVEVTFNADGALVRAAEPYDSSNGGDPVDFGPGTKKVFVTITARDYEETSISGYALGAAAARDVALGAETNARAAQVATELAAENVTATVANAAPNYTTWAALNATTPDAGSIAVLTVNDAGHARGQYRYISSVWTWEADTLPGVDARFTPVEPDTTRLIGRMAGGSSEDTMAGSLVYGWLGPDGRVALGVDRVKGPVARRLLFTNPSVEDADLISLIMGEDGRVKLGYSQALRTLLASRLGVKGLLVRGLASDDTDLVPLALGEDGRMLLGYDQAQRAMRMARTILKGLRLGAIPNLDDYALVPIILGDNGRILVGAEADGLRLGLSQAALDLADGKRRLKPDAVPSSLLAEPDDVWRISASLISARARDDAGVTRTFLLRRDRTPGCAMAETRGPIELLKSNGQSLDIGGGADAIPVPSDRIVRATPARPYLNLMFNDGLIGAVSNDTLDEASLVDFAPAVEVGVGDAGEVLGDSGLNAFGDMMAYLREQAGLPRRTHLLRTHGKGGRPITSLNKGTLGYDNGLKESRAAVRIAAKYGRTVRFRDWIWQQGQTQVADPQPDPPLSDPIGYYNQLVQLVSDYATDNCAITGDNPADVICWIEQTSSSEAGNTLRGASLGQLKAAEDYPDKIKIVGPYYFLDGDQGLIDDVHLKPKGYCILRELDAKAIHTQRELGITWTGVRPKGPLQISGTTSIVPLYKQSGYALAFDTVTIPAQTNMGVILEGYGSGITITNVQLVDVDATTCNLVVTTSGAPTDPTPVISYARQGGTILGRPAMRVRGNIADTDPLMSRAVPGYSLRNRCCIFEKGTA